MTDNEKLIEAAKLLQENCERYKDCNKGCVFFSGGCCIKDRGRYPKHWHIPKPRRFTDEDIALAMALKAFGVFQVSRHTGYKYCTAYDSNFMDEVTLPYKAFTDIKEREVVLIDDIIKEGDQQ